MLPRPILIACLAPFLPVGLVAKTEPPADPIEQAWTDATLYQFKEAYRLVADADTREGRLARAALLLLQQPKTDANLRDAVAALEQLASAPPSSADEPAIAARYLLGRVAHAHLATPDLATAADLYRRLVAEHPDHFLADQARVKLALIELYDPAIPRDELLARVDRIGADADALARPGSRRDLHLVLASACANLRLDDERCLRHYLAADQAGVERPLLRANVTVAVGELARRLGRDDLARRYFERFLAEFRRDYRRALVRDKLASLPPALETRP